MDKKFKGYLQYFEEKFPIGKETNKIDIEGNKLNTGDVVTFDVENNNSTISIVCTSEGEIMGIWDFSQERLIKKFKVKKIRNYKDLEHGETVNGVDVVLEKQLSDYTNEELLKELENRLK
ncbi:DNA topoisomerase [Clostridium botulinum B str. Osaka05]|uniref:DNA topoisomerase n=1 Tax=Clostridium botulinum B str. Osaka05 TaxID=1407017 RepID=A0A060N9E1_CLOBO|nr:hypothetical protein [Clostridium botulinum]BAO04779.1 DNA topoisomerase [Clostridium botulinum B str. Osaka05]